MTITRSNPIRLIRAVILGKSIFGLDTCLLNDVILSLCDMTVIENFKYWNKVQPRHSKPHKVIWIQWKRRSTCTSMKSDKCPHINEVLFKINFDITTEIWFHRQLLLTTTTTTATTTHTCDLSRSGVNLPIWRLPLRPADEAAKIPIFMNSDFSLLPKAKTCFPITADACFISARPRAAEYTIGICKEKAKKPKVSKWLIPSGSQSKHLFYHQCRKPFILKSRRSLAVLRPGQSVLLFQNRLGLTGILHSFLVASVGLLLDVSWHLQRL